MFKVKHLFCGLLLTLGSSFSLHAHWNQFILNPYVGVEGAWRHWPWKAAFGERHFKENYTNHNGVIGLQFHTFFAIEAGYQTTDRQQKQEFYNGDGLNAEPVLGFLRPPGLRESVLHISEARMSGPHINLIGLLPIFNTTTMYASLGVAWMRFYVSTIGINDDPVTLIPVTRWNSDRHSILQLGLGIKQMLSPNFGAKAFYKWENTNRLVGSFAPSPLVGAFVPILPSDFYTARSKNNHLIGLGLFYQLCPSMF